MPASRFYSNLVTMQAEQQDLEARLKAAWAEYDTTVDSITGNRRKHLEHIASKYGVSHLDVLEWYDSQSD